MKKTVVLVAAMTLALVGCSGTSEAQAPAPEPVEVVQEDTATPQQLASVIAEHEADWRDMRENQSECRLIWVMESQDDPLANIQGMTCYLRETTEIVSAGNAVRDFESLASPPEMQDLVDRTIAELKQIAEIEMQVSCGQGDWPAETDECTKALASSFALFGTLTQTLDAWKPYL